jgi:hypothetical protein
MPFWGGKKLSSSSSSSTQSRLGNSYQNQRRGQLLDGSSADSAARQAGGTSVSSIARSIIPHRRRLRLDPPTKLFFPCMNPVSPPFSSLSATFLQFVYCSILLPILSHFSVDRVID